MLTFYEFSIRILLLCYMYNVSLAKIKIELKVDIFSKFLLHRVAHGLEIFLNLAKIKSLVSFKILFIYKKLITQKDFFNFFFRHIRST